jgi:predicted RNA-binding Zn-ribbon protein involved in translation (DUF1610 family)
MVTEKCPECGAEVLFHLKVTRSDEGIQHESTSICGACGVQLRLSTETSDETRVHVVQK